MENILENYEVEEVTIIDANESDDDCFLCCVVGGGTGGQKG
jgi:hypothetical protein